MANGGQKQIFRIKDCALITRMAGISSAINTRELRERLATCPLESLYHHFCETVIRPSFDDPEFRNDFAIWSSRFLGDRVLAERLGILNPYAFGKLSQLRETVLELLDDRLAEQRQCNGIQAHEEFRFLQAATVVFDTGLNLCSLEDLIEALPDMSYSSIYYHFVEARRRTPDRSDDFSLWLHALPQDTEWFESSLRHIDFYFLNLTELKAELIAASAWGGGP